MRVISEKFSRILHTIICCGYLIVPTTYGFQENSEKNYSVNYLLSIPLIRLILDLAEKQEKITLICSMKLHVLVPGSVRCVLN